MIVRPHLIGNRNAATHGMSRTPEYQAWAKMQRRCNDEADGSYARYGARGIRVCDLWTDSFEAFIADVGLRPASGWSLNRINNDGHYEPGNVAWANATTQARNRRGNRILGLGNLRLTVAEWSERVGISSAAIRRRLANGWTVEDALSRPVQLRTSRR